MKREFIKIAAPAHMASYLINGEVDGVSDEDIQAVATWLDGLEVIDVARGADGWCMEPYFSWAYGLHGGTAQGGELLDYIVLPGEEVAL